MQLPHEEQILVPATRNGGLVGHPESESFRITDQLLRRLESSPRGVFVANIPAAGLMAETGDLEKTVAAIQYVDTCIGGICEKVRELNGVMMITSSYGSCEEMAEAVDGERIMAATNNPVPFHYIDYASDRVQLAENGALEDIAPTILGVLGIDKPVEMTGSDLREI
jgi:2,3-bisphosphoglycerate-independent phosphoglycerate mutase